jgi:hypothetical protein
LAASTEFVVGDPDAQHVLIRLLSRRQPGLFDRGDHRDANWIECECGIAAGAFRAEIRADVRAEELSAFLDGLRALATSGEGPAALMPMEGQLALTLDTAGGGRIQASGEAIDGDGNRLQFRFDVAASSLPQACESLERALAVFPVIGAVPEV